MKSKEFFIYETSFNQLSEKRFSLIIEAAKGKRASKILYSMPLLSKSFANILPANPAPTILYIPSIVLQGVQCLVQPYICCVGMNDIYKATFQLRLFSYPYCYCVATSNH